MVAAWNVWDFSFRPSSFSGEAHLITMNLVAQILDVFVTIGV